MNAEEIRGKQFATFQSHEVYLLRELAAQVAEVVEQLRILNEPVEQVEVAKPKWVWLSYNGGSYPARADQIFSVRRTADRNRCLIYFSGITEPWTVDGSMEEVCAKLGIPVEG